MRYAHLVGSLPGSTAREAVGATVDIVGDHLRTVTDGETGERQNWGQWIVEALRTHPDLTEVRSGGWTGYQDVPRMRTRRGRQLHGGALDLGYAHAARHGFPVVDELRRAADRADLRFQCGMASPLGLALMTFGAPGLARQRPFVDATLSDIHSVQAIAGTDTLFQIELPLEVTMISKAPRVLDAATAQLVARSTLALAAAAPAGTRFAIHLCVGDMRHRAATTLTDVTPLVVMANHLTRNWPDHTHLELLHAPFAAASRPAPATPKFYRPLAKLQLPAGTRFAAGFVHERPPVDQLLTVRDLIESTIGHEVDVAAACGLGRRPIAAASEVLRRTHLVAQST